MREIIQHCYTHYGLDPEEYIQEDPEDTRERGIEPADLNPSTSVQDWQQDAILSPLPPTPWQPASIPSPRQLTFTPKSHQTSRKRA